ncbi:MAG: hypothetical protein Q9166_002828 [cf. Caloplaca sp. 2 TL-2023]
MDGVSIAASLVGIGAAGCQIAIKLYTLATQISTASQRISSISNDVSLTSGVLKELGEFMTRETADDGTTIFSQSGLDTTRRSAVICENIFHEIEQAARDASEQLRTRDKFVGKIKLSKSEKAKWPFLQPSIDSLRIDLREAKGTLMLMLQVMNLALSQRMATIHQTTSMNIIEQREIYRAILAIQKQAQGNGSTRSKPLSGDCSSTGTPRVAYPLPPASPAHLTNKSSPGEGPALAVSAFPPSSASPTHLTEKSSPDQEPALGPSPFANPAASLRLKSHVFVATPEPDKPDPPVLKELKRNPVTENTSSTSTDHTFGIRHDDMNSTSNQSSSGGSKSMHTKSNGGSQGEECKVLHLLVIKPFIKDDFDNIGGILLTYKVTKIPIEQADIQKHLSNSQGEGLPPVLDVYPELFLHERQVIREEIEDIGSGASLIMLKRSHADIWYREILFKGVPELQFILMGRTEKRKEPVADTQESRRIVDLARPTWIRVHQRYLDGDTLDAYDLPWVRDERDPNIIIIQRYLNKNDQGILFEHTRKLRESKLRPNVEVELKKDIGKLKLVREKRPSRERRVDRSWIFNDERSPSPGRPGKSVDDDGSSDGAAPGHRARDQSWEGRRRQSHDEHGSRSPSPYWDLEMQRKLQKLEEMERKKVEGAAEERVLHEAELEAGTRHRHPTRVSDVLEEDDSDDGPITCRAVPPGIALERESKSAGSSVDSLQRRLRSRDDISNSGDSDESEEDVDDDAMDDEETERAVKELLRKYTTLGAVVRESVGSAGGGGGGG